MWPTQPASRSVDRPDAGSVGHVTRSVMATLLLVATSLADPPVTTYVFPAGGRRGETVNVRVGGLYLHDRCAWEMLGPGVIVSPDLTSTKTVWFEGPVIPLPDSQRQEDYPKDMAGTVQIATDATPGFRAWRAWTSQGACPSRPFVVGDLPEIVEQETDGEQIPKAITLPVTINGRIFPREDVDVWMFDAKAGRSVTCAVLADSLGSPLKARLEIRDSAGQPLAESRSAPFCDAFVRFTPKVDGVYVVRIHDLQFGGLQHYVYRLTVTDGPWVDRVEPLGGRRGSPLAARLFGQALPAETTSLDLPADSRSLMWWNALPGGPGTNLFPIATDDLPEVGELSANTTPAEVAPAAVPAVFNGVIEAPGDVDCWTFAAKKGDAWTVSLTARPLGSRLEAAVTVLHASSKELAKGEEADVPFTAPEDGTYCVRVADQFSSRGGPDFGYRLKIAPKDAPQLALEVPADALTLERGKDVKLLVKVAHPVKPDGEVRFEAEGLPAGVTFEAKPKGPQHELQFKADATAKIGAARVRIRGFTTGPDQSATAVFRTATQPSLEIDTLLLGVALPTPYKVKGVYEVKYAQRGGLFTRHFTLDRGGFTGPLTVSLGDKQARHLQGVTGPTITVPAEANEFDYTIYLPPWMEIGRTSRSVIMAVGEVTEPDGSKHKVSFTSVAQNEQMVALVDPGQLGLEVSTPTVRMVPGQTVRIGLRLGRGVGVRSPAQVDVVIPEHIQGVKAESLVLDAERSDGELSLTFGDRVGPLNMPLTLRATATQNERPIVAEAKLELVP